MHTVRLVNRFEITPLPPRTLRPTYHSYVLCICIVGIWCSANCHFNQILDKSAKPKSFTRINVYLTPSLILGVNYPKDDLPIHTTKMDNKQLFIFYLPNSVGYKVYVCISG